MRLTMRLCWLTASSAAILCLIAITARAQVDAASVSPPGVSGRWNLDDVVALALSNNPLVGQADAGVRAAVARRGQRASSRLPQASATSDWSWAEAPSSMTGDQVRSTTTSVKGTVSLLLSDFGRTGAAVDRAGELADASAQSARSSRVEAVFAAKVAYFNVLRAGSLQALSRETLRQREGLQRQAQAFYDAGLKAKIDVVRAEANLYQARADSVAVEHEVNTAHLILLNQMGVDGPANFELAEVPDVVEATGTIEDWLREAEEQHPDLGALRLQLAAARSNRLAAARGDNPSVTATGTLGWSGTDEMLANRAWSVGAQLTVPLFNGHLTRQQTAEAEAEVAAAKFELSDRRRQIRL